MYSTNPDTDVSQAQSGGSVMLVPVAVEPVVVAVALHDLDSIVCCTSELCIMQIEYLQCHQIFSSWHNSNMRIFWKRSLPLNLPAVC